MANEGTEKKEATTPYADALRKSQEAYRASNRAGGDLRRALDEANAQINTAVTAFALSGGRVELVWVEDSEEGVIAIRGHLTGRVRRLFKVTLLAAGYCIHFEWGPPHQRFVATRPEDVEGGLCAALRCPEVARKIDDMVNAEANTILIRMREREIISTIEERAVQDLVKKEDERVVQCIGRALEEYKLSPADWRVLEAVERLRIRSAIMLCRVAELSQRTYRDRIDKLVARGLIHKERSAYKLSSEGDRVLWERRVRRAGRVRHKRPGA